MKARFRGFGRAEPSRRLRLELEPEPGDPVDSPSASLAKHRAAFTLPEEFDLEDTHSDVLALAVLLSCRPWIGSRLRLDRPVSAFFAEVVHEQFAIVLEPVDGKLSPRERPPGPRPGVAFSGGVDSVAAAGLLPGEPVLYFLDRAIPLDRRDAIDKQAAQVSCEDMRNQGFTVREVVTDVEYLRRPTGAPVNLPTDLSFALPAVLCADVDGLDALITGIHASSVYGLGGGAFGDLAPDHALLQWQAVTAAVGLGLQPVAAGLTEVSTALVVEKLWGEEVLTQSCNLGEPGLPCGACRNCFRKSLILAAHTGSWPDAGNAGRLIGNFQSLGDLSAVPVSNECSIAFAMSRYDGDDQRLAALRERYYEPGDDLEWMTHHYGPSLELLDERYREPVRRRIADFVVSMDERQLAACRSWDRRRRAVRRSGWQEAQKLQHFLTSYGRLVPSKAGVLADPRPYLPRGVGDRHVSATEASLSVMSQDVDPAPGLRVSVLVPNRSVPSWRSSLGGLGYPCELVELIGIENGPEALADGFAQGRGAVLMWTAADAEPPSGILASHLRWHGSAENILIFGDRKFPMMSLHRMLLVAAGGYDDTILDGADVELAYRASLAGAVLADAGGRPVDPPWRDAAADDLRLAHQIPETPTRDDRRWRSWSVPLVDIVVETESHRFESVLGCVSPLLGGACRDIRVTLVGSWTNPWDWGRNPVSERDMIREALAADPRVRFTTWNRVRADSSVPWRMQVDPRTRITRDTMADLLARAERRQASLVTVDAGDQALIRLERRSAFARAAWSGAMSADLDAHASEFGPVLRLTAGDIGLASV